MSWMILPSVWGLKWQMKIEFCRCFRGDEELKYPIESSTTANFIHGTYDDEINWIRD